MGINPPPSPSTFDQGFVFSFVLFLRTLFDSWLQEEGSYYCKGDVAF